MKIRVYCAKYNGKRSWCADPVDMPGSPVVGTGRNYLEAIGDLMVNAQKDMNITFDIVDENGKRWEHFCGHAYKRANRRKNR